jgi:uncharacterized protein
VQDQDVELVRDSYEAWNRRNFQVIWERLDPDVVVDATARIMNPDTYHGHAGFQRMVDEMEDIWQEWHLEPEAFLDGGDRIIVVTRVRARGRGSGVELDDLNYNVWKLRDGRAVRLAIYYDKDEALCDHEKEGASAAH